MADRVILRFQLNNSKGKERSNEGETGVKEESPKVEVQVAMLSLLLALASYELASDHPAFGKDVIARCEWLSSYLSAAKSMLEIQLGELVKKLQGSYEGHVE